VIDSYPSSDSAWRVHVTNTGASADFVVYAICGVVG